MVRIFVYGTLRKGMYNHDLYLKNRGTYCGEGYIKGSLMTIAGKIYPAFLPEGQDLVLGELYDVDEQTLKHLDELECYFGDGHQDNEYNKINMDIFDKNGQLSDQAYVYVFNMDNPKNVNILGEDILELDYVKYIQKQKIRKQSLFEDDKLIF